MTDVRRMRAVWTGLPGSPYLSTWHFRATTGNPAVMVTAVRKFLTSLAAQCRTGISVTLEADQLIFNAEKGDVVGVESAPPGAAILGTAGGNALPFASQGVIKLATGGIVNNRRVRGRFYVPCPSDLANSAGIPLSGYTSVLQGAADVLITDTSAAGKWAVWSRPFEPDPEVLKPQPAARDGSLHDIQAATTFSKWGVQRRRRD